MRHFVRAFTAAALVALVSSSASATTVRNLSNQDLAHDADVIVIGTATTARSVWEGRTLVRVVTVDVTETLKGEPVDTVTVALPGGIDANRPVPVAMTYAGAPQMRPGEEVFLFLNRDADVASGYTVVGFSQGKFSIVTEAGGTRVVTRDLSAVLLDSASGVAPGARSLVSLAEFRAEIAELVK